MLILYSQVESHFVIQLLRLAMLVPGVSNSKQE
ncbi:MAG TPA: hypothetical protein DEB17_10395 [Chlorobaculum sp.]|uniref:Uncharacterized protein n=1 Tax=Chlorobaculum tepidum (strain ATCC 49652 / DSM 12025 / NBRC 103806 / TLS) TaxID=194439 RepID=Q8KG49_CHLTE|nr:hypothetical protein CT0119 [Chlorobaculum tepidum TLS]HBU24378.1 hypothetical protein [Chlorobaculum sp.]